MQTYQGSCHCRKVRFEIEVEPITTAMSCNCSICSRVGWLILGVPGAQFKLLAGEADLSDYQFGNKNIHHVFCRNCGVRAFSHVTTKDGREMRAVNARCLEGLDLGAVAIKQVDGKSIPIPHEG